MTTTLTRRSASALAFTGAIGLFGKVAGACDIHQPATLQLAAAGGMPSRGDVDAVLRDLWIGHAFYVRAVVQATVGASKPAAEAAEAAVVANAKAIAGAIKPFYGDKAVDALFKLLAGHYTGIKSFLLAAVAKDKAGQDKAVAAVTANAGEIAGFLSAANPNLPKDAVMGLLEAHAGHHIAQIQQFIAGDYKGELETWADMSQHMYVIADALADALAKQFPDQFKA